MLLYGILSELGDLRANFDDMIVLVGEKGLVYINCTCKL